MLVEVFGNPLGYPLNMWLGLALDKYFYTWEGCLVGVSLDTLDGLIIGTGGGSLVGLSLRLPLGPLLEPPNTGAEIGSLFESLTGVILGISLGNSLASLLDSIWCINRCVP